MRENDQTLWGGEEGGGEAEQISPEILITFSLQHGHGHEVVCLLACFERFDNESIMSSVIPAYKKDDVSFCKVVSCFSSYIKWFCTRFLWRSHVGVLFFLSFFLPEVWVKTDRIKIYFRVLDKQGNDIGGNSTLQQPVTDVR